MISTTWQVGGDPLPIFNARCGLATRLAKEYLGRAHLIFVDIRYQSGGLTFDPQGYLPHLQYTPDYERTEGDKGEFIMTGNHATAPVWRFDAAPFFADVSGSICLTGGDGDAIFGVRVAIKRYAKWKPLRHTLTVGTAPGRFARPFGCNGVWLPDQSVTATFAVGGVTQPVTSPNGGFVAFGPFDQVSFSPLDSVATFEITLPC